MDDMAWHIADAATGDVSGPLSGAELLAGIETGQITSDDSLWCEGMTGWQPLSRLSWLLMPAPPG